MASIGGLSGATSNSIRGYGGLASGMDRDELITNMTAGTQAKIDKQLREKQLLKWEQEAIRGITDKMYAFSSKYTSYANPYTNLAGSAIFNQMSVTALGANSKYIGISGSSKLAASMSILGIKQLAQNTKLTGKNAASDKVLESGEINTGDMEVSNVAGKSITVQYGNKFYTATIGSIDVVSAADVGGNAAEAQRQNMQATKTAIEEALGKTKIAGGKLLSDVMGVELTDEGAMKFTSKDTAGNTLTLIGGTGSNAGNVMRALGFIGMGEQMPEKGYEISRDSGLTATNSTVLSFNTTFDQRMSNKNITFNYNGTKKSIKLPSAHDIKEAMDAAVAAGEDGEMAGLKFIADSMQDSLNEAFGTGRVEVKLDGKALKIRTTKPSGGYDDSSIISVTSADGGMLGEKGFLSMMSGESNRINLSAPLKKSGINGVGGLALPDHFGVKINGEDFWIDSSKSLKEIMDEINNSGAKVKMSYLENSDKFVLEATEKGESGKIEVTDPSGVFTSIFGDMNDPDNYEKTQGQDAIVTVKYDTGEQVDMVRDSNSFTIDGMTITLKDKFGYKDVTDSTTGVTSSVYDPSSTDPITFDTTVESENIVKTVKEMVEDFNEILKLVNDELRTKPNRDYPPLTASDKENYSEEQIKQYEEKAKAGMLFADFDLQSLSDKLRWVIPTGGEDKAAMTEMGITITTDYSGNGKIVFDENKFKAAFENDPDKVKELFIREEDSATNTKKGFMVAISDTVEQFAGTLGATKGVLIERAGSQYAPTTVLDNAILTEMDRIDKIVENYKDQLESQTDRYIQQFTTMEMLISQMNSQSSWLSSALGGA